MCYASLMDPLGSTGKRIRALRFDLGMTQVEVGRLIGKSSGYMSMLEADDVPGVSAIILKEIAGILGTTVDYLVLATDDPLPPPEELREEVPDHIARFNSLIEALPGSLQEKAIDYLRQQLRLWKDIALPDSQERSRDPAGRHRDEPGGTAL